MTKLNDWFIGVTRLVNGRIIERHYGFFKDLVNGKCYHAETMEELEEQIENSSQSNRS